MCGGFQLGDALHQSSYYASRLAVSVALGLQLALHEPHPVAQLLYQRIMVYL